MADGHDSQHEAGSGDVTASPYHLAPPSCRGFTLIEIAVVLVIIGMFMMLVLPRLPSTESEDVKISARTLASTLRYLQERAAVMQTVYYLKMEPGTDRVRVMERGADGNEKEPDDPLLRKRIVREGVVVADVSTPRSGRISDGQVKLDVGVSGLRERAVIHLRSPEGLFWTVMAFPSSGKVKVLEGSLEELP